MLIPRLSQFSSASWRGIKARITRKTHKHRKDTNNVLWNGRKKKKKDRDKNRRFGIAIKETVRRRRTTKGTTEEINDPTKIIHTKVLSASILEAWIRPLFLLVVFAPLSSLMFLSPSCRSWKQIQRSNDPTIQRSRSIPKALKNKKDVFSLTIKSAFASYLSFREKRKRGEKRKATKKKKVDHVIMYMWGEGCQVHRF